MTVGQPDYQVTPGQVNEVSSDDVLELASRLNAIGTVNRSGQQVYSIADVICISRFMWYSSSGTGYFIPAQSLATSAGRH